MPTTKRSNDCSGAGVGLILTGMALALLGAASVMLLVIGASGLYVGRFTPALAELAGFILGSGIFLKSYGPYLARLEKRAPMDSDTTMPHDPSVPDSPPGEVAERPPEAAALERSISEPARQGERSVADPLPTSVIVSLATGAYGLLVAAGGLIWTRGGDLVLNVLAGGALLIAAALVWRLGRTSSESSAGG